MAKRSTLEVLLQRQEELNKKIAEEKRKQRVKKSKDFVEITLKSIEFNKIEEIVDKPEIIFGLLENYKNMSEEEKENLYVESQIKYEELKEQNKRKRPSTAKVSESVNEE